MPTPCLSGFVRAQECFRLLQGAHAGGRADGLDAESADGIREASGALDIPAPEEAAEETGVPRVAGPGPVYGFHLEGGHGEIAVGRLDVTALLTQLQRDGLHA